MKTSPQSDAGLWLFESTILLWLTALDHGPVTQTRALLSTPSLKEEEVQLGDKS